MERNVSRADGPPVSLKADCLPSRATAEPSHTPDDNEPVADNDKFDVSAVVAMMANTTMQRKFDSAGGQDRSQVMHR